MFEKILIANRGEIAVRVVRACRDLGIPSVAVYSEADRGALHARLADEAFCCGPARAQDSYLAVEGLIGIARRAGCDAVHPGYGFLSENADFADACEHAGLAFIGPPGPVIRAMGDKVTSRRIMREAGVPVVPGSDDALSDEQAIAFAREIGLPVMVKASGGGGGRGLRVVTREQDLQQAVERARSEAASSFGSDAIYVEKALRAPRHVEVQILADRHGRALHLFERECSVQRRHQKLIEEAPAPGVDAALRERLGETALRAARAVDYHGVGTVEFLLDEGGDFYFLEMNTRVQVEHPVTEAITGTDIVKEMIRLAAGEPLSPGCPAIDGHAIEARVYAEDPSRGFLPSPGRLAVFRPPSGPGVRVDAGVQAGDAVTPHYDALLAKVVAWGSTRAEAVARLDRALAEFAVAGVETSISFHRRALRDPRFVAGRYDTSFAEGVAEDGPAPAGRLALAATLVAVASGATSPLRLRCRGSGAAPDPIDVTWEGEPPGLTATVDGETVALEAVPGPGGAWSVLADGRSGEAFVVEKKPGRFAVRVGDGSGSHAFVLEVLEPQPAGEGGDG